MEEEILPGFHVYHRPTEESLVVAYADIKGDEVSALGWPDSTARLSDCDGVKRFGAKEVIDTVVPSAPSNCTAPGSRPRARCWRTNRERHDGSTSRLRPP